MDEKLNFGWDDAIEVEAHQEYVILPEGDYEFTVKKFEREWFEKTNPSGKRPSCNVAVYTLGIDWLDGDVLRSNIIVYKLYLATREKFKVSNFFKAIGMLSEDSVEQFRPDWQGAVGHRGIVKIIQRTFEGRNGTGTVNDVDSVYTPSKAPKTYKNKVLLPTDSEADIPF